MIKATKEINIKKVIAIIPPSEGGLSQASATTTRSAPSKAAAEAILVVVGVLAIASMSIFDLLIIFHLCLDFLNYVLF
ncbi:MAG: hypothetical protein ACFFDN_41305 [Candidatus Hodarchaeota archaeon]